MALDFTNFATFQQNMPFNDVDGTPLDQGIALWFPGPNSFTGEDVLELQGHGGPVILDLLLKRILTLPGLRRCLRRIST